MMKKNDHIIATCQGYTNEGHGVVKIDGYPLFVKGMMKDEEGELIVTLMKKTYGYAKLHKLHKANPMRIQPQCALAKQCGGCQLQHMDYAEQKAFKTQKVKDIIQRIGKCNAPVYDVLGMDDPWYYRNKGQVPVGVEKNRVKMGFYRLNSNQIIDCEHCAIQSQKINAIMQTFRGLLETYDLAHFFRHLLIKDGFHSGELMAVLIVRARKIPHLNAMVEALVEAHPEIKTVVLNINQRNDNVILGDKEVTLYGNGQIYDVLDGLKFSISSKSFYQVNPIQTKVLYQTALDFANLTGDETVIDLYCGVGTISMFLARKAKKVIGIEIVDAAIQDAKRNAKLNGIENIEFHCADAGTYAKKLASQKLIPDVVVVDPPRKGCDGLTLDSIVTMAPKRIVYVSCDPATLARDIAILETKGYKCEKVQPVDMFPHTHHVENVCLLSKKEK